jgi:hypothetical protein
MTQTFKVTSDVPYDRHTYEVVLKNDKKVFFDNWTDAQGFWFQNCQIPDFLDVIIVKDKQKVKSKGFGQ